MGVGVGVGVGLGVGVGVGAGTVKTMREGSWSSADADADEDAEVRKPSQLTDLLCTTKYCIYVRMNPLASTALQEILGEGDVDVLQVRYLLP